MNRFIDARDFFGDERPSAVPDDAAAPDFDALVKRAESLDSGRFPLDGIADILAREHGRLGAPEATKRRIEAIGPDTVFVVAGQQAGLFGGPLYTLYKAMHAVGLSRRLSHASGRDVVPLFWVASDDHDFDEVGSLGLNTGDGNTVRVSCRPANLTDGMPVSALRLDGGITDALETLKSSLPPGDVGEDYQNMLHDVWRPGERWTDAFARQLLFLFRDRGLVLFDPAWEGVKGLFRDIFLVELDDPAASVRLINERADAFDSARLRKKALRRPETATNLFIIVNGIRQTLEYEDGSFRAGDSRFSDRDIRAIVRSEPERISPAAALRPVCQDAVLPTAALVAGPGERLYLGQARPVYDLFGIAPSIVWPRASFTVIDMRTLRNARREGVEPPLLFGGMDRITSFLAEKTFPPELDTAFAGLERAVETGFDRIAETITELDPTLSDAARKEAGRAVHIVEGLRGKAIRSHKAAMDVSERRLRTAAAFLLPENHPQERWFGADAILHALDGGGFESFIEATSPGEENHRIVMPE